MSGHLLYYRPWTRCIARPLGRRHTVACPAKGTHQLHYISYFLQQQIWPYPQERIDADHPTVWAINKWASRTLVSNNEYAFYIHFCPISLWKSQASTANTFEKFPFNSPINHTLLKGKKKRGQFTLQEWVRNWAWNVIKISLDHQATQDFPAGRRKKVYNDTLGDDEQHVKRPMGVACKLIKFNSWQESR